MKINEVEYLGLSCACVEITQDGNLIPKFFLFSDIDTHDQEILRTVTQHFARNGLSFFIIRTNKGYHVVSPCLLTLAEWNEKKNLIRKLVQNYYRFEVIRVSNKKNDQWVGFCTEWFDQEKYKQSKELINLYLKRFNQEKTFGTFINPGSTTKLHFVKYTHHEIDF